MNLVKYSLDAHNTYGLTHKLTKRHIDFHDRKMCVRTAVQLFSNSVADSMEFLMNKGVPEFKNAGATIKFTRIFNRLFDTMNTDRVKGGDIFKSAINEENKEQIFKFLNEAKEYILSLKVSRKKGGKGKLVPVVKSTVKAGFRGFVINIVSILKMYDEYVEKQKCMRYMATYRLSQDHLEMFFGRIRSMHGWNDNPTVQQFTSSFKKLLHRCDVRISAYSNISIGCTSNILTVSSRRVKLYDDMSGDVVAPVTQNENLEAEAELDIDVYAIEQLERGNYLTEEMHAAGVTFVATLIENRMLSTDMCQFRRLALEQNEKIDAKMCLTAASRKPCKSTYNLCKLADTAIKTLLPCYSQPTFKQKIYVYVLSNIDVQRLYPDFVEEEDHDCDHKNFIIKFVIDEYTRIKCAHLAKMKTIDMQRRYLRTIFRKNLHYMGQ